MDLLLLVGGVTVTCPTCGVSFAVPRSYFDQKVATRGFLWCPEAHNIQLGVDSPQEKHIRNLELAAGEQGRMIIDLRAEVTQLRAGAVDALVGPATAPEGERP